MYHPSTRLLTILELLQSYGTLSGAELARRLEVDDRTIRRYIVKLQDMGIPIEAERGRYGTYRLGTGYKLPPLMFSLSEALAILLSLTIAERSMLAGGELALAGALAKLERVLPPDLVTQLRAISQALSVDLALPPAVPVRMEWLSLLGMAIHEQQVVTMRHSTYHGVTSERQVSPYALAYRMGRWYLVGYCHLREAIRTFRIDRITDLTTTAQIFTPPANFSPLPYIEQAIAATPGIYAVTIHFAADEARVRPHISPVLGTLTPSADGVYLRCYLQQLEWFAGFLVGLPFRWEVVEGAALLAVLAQMAEQLQRFMPEQ